MKNFGAILFLVGLIMVLVPIFRAVFIALNELFNFNTWLGVAVVGIIFVIIGALLIPY